MEPEVLSYIESWIRQSVVLIHVDGLPIQTGFFISRKGLVCTCYHGLHRKRPDSLTIGWNDRTYPATISFSSPLEDLAILSVITEPAKVGELLPLTAMVGTKEYRHQAVSFGYGGLGTDGVPDAARLFHGEISIRYAAGPQERLDLFLIGGVKGQSGAPVVDLSRLRAVGYVRASYAQTRGLNGDALTFTRVVEAFPDLAEEWRDACTHFDQTLATQFRQSPFHLDLTETPDDFIAALVSGHVADVFAGHRDLELFELDRYVPRAVETALWEFLGESTNNLLILSGASGSGKTSLLLNLVRELQRAGKLPLLVKCSSRAVREIPELALQALLPNEHYDLRQLSLTMSRCPERQWVLIVDGLNECTNFSLTEFRETVMALHSLSRTPGLNLKVIFSVRTEFLREHLQSFFFWQNIAHDDPDADLLQFFERDDRGQPYYSVGRINETVLPNGHSELQEMYERYSQTGLRPLTKYEQLSPPIIEMLDRPFVLDLMMRIYNGAEIPLSMGRSSLIREVVQRTLKKSGIQSVRANEIAIYLSELAMFIAASGRRESLDSDLYKERWHRTDHLELLLDATPFLERECIQRSYGEENIIRFSADWTLEFFAARYLWEWWRQNGGRPVAEMLSTFHLQLPSINDGVDLQHLVIALVFFAEWSVTDDLSRFPLLVGVMNDPEHSALALAFTRECLDFFRVTYGLDQQILSRDGEKKTSLFELLNQNKEYFGRTAAVGCLDYIDYLETIGEKREALLDLTVLQEVVAQNEDLRLRHDVSLALSLYGRHDIDGALAVANRIEVERLSSPLRAKHAFVLGRAYQFRGDFDRAEQAFDVGRTQSSVFAYRCEHQLAFIRIISKSDFRGVQSLLKRLLDDKSFELTRGQRFASMLLHATCLFRLGDYEKAEVELAEIIRLVTAQRNKQELGLALRALAEAQFHECEFSKALATVDQAISTLQDRSYYLSMATAYDTKAQILGLLAGDLAAARDYSDRAIKLSREAKHDANIRWFLQTAALLAALTGDGKRALELVQAAGAASPFEKLRKRFVSVLASYFTSDYQATLGDELRRLQIEFQDLGLAFYPGVIKLIELALAGERPEIDAVKQIFPPGTNVTGVLNSYLCARIFPAR